MPSSSLDSSLAVIRQQEQLMRRCLDTKGRLMDALRHASLLLAELRANTLSPKQYYEVYMAAFDALSNLSVSLKDFHPGNHLADVYELVQYAGNIIPRLYLMITVGTAYMSVDDAPCREIMKDMMEMCRGVQHPIRGLFLRYYLSQKSKELLPVGSADTVQGNLNDSIQFILTNFVEMNKLWVRLQHQGHTRERNQRTLERQELQILVGSNLVRLSQLDGIDCEFYSEKILPAVLEQIVQCRDVLAQEYLLDVITQVFPDEFHLHTLKQFMNAIEHLNPGVSIKRIVGTMVDRLAKFSQREGDNERLEAKLRKELTLATTEKVGTSENSTEAVSSVPISTISQTETDSKGKEKPDDANSNENNDINEPISDTENQMTIENSKEDETIVNGIPRSIPLFEIVWKNVVTLLSSRELPLADTTSLLCSICRLSLFAYPENPENLSILFNYTLDTVIQPNKDTLDLHSNETSGNLLSLLMGPIDFYPKLVTVLKINGFNELLKSQSERTQKVIANGVIDTILKNPDSKIRHPEQAEGLFGLLSVIIKSSSSVIPNQSAQQEKQASSEYSKLSKIVHLLYNKDPDVNLKLIQIARNALLGGGADRLEYTFPALVTSTLKLVRRYARLRLNIIRYEQKHGEIDPTDEVKARIMKRKFNGETVFTITTKISATFKLTSRVISDLYYRQPSCSEKVLRLYVLAAQLADQVYLAPLSYEFFALAFQIYEESISDSRAQYQAVCVLIQALQGCRSFSSDGKSNGIGGSGSKDVSDDSDGNSYDTLITKCALYGSKLLKKVDQCRAVYLVSHLWWHEDYELGDDEQKDQQLESNEENSEAKTSGGTDSSSDEMAGKLRDTPLPFQDGKRVLECLQRSLRVADACMDSVMSVKLFVEILEQYIYYFERGNSFIEVKYVNGLIELITNTIESAANDDLNTNSLSMSGSINPILNGNSAGGGELEATKGHFHRVINYLESRREEEGGRFLELVW
ncbi:vacuolar protein sorting-associated protein 35 [Nadsonia fulvescens var. elongata DSM 6958]|uniref:Vacuolar protein sorting-associated protein 35 n=1 Tax=Nadsonia fulvescens var. elongata DSM 6958 TaxID=857566 RepID=A0A1E3PTI6_9ASCO|nr:vacuolar protein sorting-associated protein 35 [Nadsonia fulvescens var. elongata DSM 6958]